MGVCGGLEGEELAVLTIGGTEVCDSFIEVLGDSILRWCDLASVVGGAVQVLVFAVVCITPPIATHKQKK